MDAQEELGRARDPQGWAGLGGEVSQAVAAVRLEGAGAGLSGAVLRALGTLLALRRNEGEGGLGLQTSAGRPCPSCCPSAASPCVLGHSQTAPARSSGTLRSSPLRVRGRAWNVPS